MSTEEPSPLGPLSVLDSSNQALTPLLSDWAGVCHSLTLLLLLTTVSPECGSVASPELRRPLSSAAAAETPSLTGCKEAV